ncbi:A1 cistron-splicing factor [Phlyctochytrium arcticum]|nr:A1 cistron-splicing factor [Phlyctochytrium arcticum]
MDQQVANALFDKGAIIIFLNAPPNLEFGIDCYAWTTGPKFLGIKLVPPGSHFVYYAAKGAGLGAGGGVRTGWWRIFKEGEIVVKKWNTDAEDVFEDSEMDPDEVERCKLSVREMDRFLGLYPLTPEGDDPVSPYQKWLNLTTKIRASDIKIILPKNGKLSAMTCVSRFTDVEHEKIRKQMEAMIKTQKEASNGVKVEGTIAEEKPSKIMEIIEEPEETKDTAENPPTEMETLRLEFTVIDLKRSFPPGATGAQITKYSQDKSWVLLNLLETAYKNDITALLGELQLSFIIFLIGQVFDGFEQWKTMVHLLCQSEEAVQQRPDLFTAFIDVICAQLTNHPVDFFDDALSAETFLRSTLINVYQSLVKYSSSQPTGTPSSTSIVPASSSSSDLRLAAGHLRQTVKQRFGWDLVSEIARMKQEELDEEDVDLGGEYAPMVVEL